MSENISDKKIAERHRSFLESVQNQFCKIIYKENITNNGEKITLSMEKKETNMKKHILSFVLVAAVIGSIATGCSSKKNVSGSDSTSVKDTTKMTTPPPSATAPPDTMKKDTTHHWCSLYAGIFSGFWRGSGIFNAAQLNSHRSIHNNAGHIILIVPKPFDDSVQGSLAS